MATFQFDLVSPSKLVFSGQVDQVDVPGSEGDFGVFAEHAPLIATLRPGVVTVHADGRQTRVVVTGGFAEVTPQVLTILADHAAPADEFDRASLAADIEETQRLSSEAPAGHLRDRLAIRADHLRALQTSLGGGAPAAH